MKRTIAALVGLWLVVPFAFAQDFEPITYRGTVSWVPANGQNGVEASVDVGIKYNLFMGEPTRMATGKATLGDRVHYNGQTYTRSQVGDEIFDDFEFGLINVEADIFLGPTKISTVRFNNLISGDIAGSPNWGDVFPGVSAESEKEAFRNGFTIRNVRLVDVQNRIFMMESWVRDRERQATYDEAMARARRMEQSGDLDGAQAAYDEAARAKPGDSAASSARTRVQTAKREQEAEARRQAQAAEQARQAEQARAEAAAASQREQEAQRQAEAQRQQDAAAAREAERQRQAREDFERVQRQARETQDNIKETEEKVRAGIAAGMAQSNANTPFFDQGMGLYVKMTPWEEEAGFLTEGGTTSKFLSVGMVGPFLRKGRFTVNVGVTTFKGDQRAPSYPTYPDTDTPIKESEVSYYGGDIGLGMKLGRGWGLLSNMAYPYVSVNLGQFSAYDAELMEDRQSEFVYSMEYGVRGMLYFLYYQAGYSEHYDQMVYSFGIVNPIRYGQRRRGG